MMRRPPESVPNIAALASALADPTRVMMCICALDGRAWTVTELAGALGISKSSTSEHVSILIDRGVLTERRQGRHRYVQIASADIADWLELSGALAGDSVDSVQSLAVKTRDRHLLEARTCYRHIAGLLGTQMFAAMVHRSWIDESTHLTESGRNCLAEVWGIDTANAPSSSRPVTRRCLDWTERRSHLGGWLGDELCRNFIDRRWVVRRENSRALKLTADGLEQLDWVLSVEARQL